MNKRMKAFHVETIKKGASTEITREKYSLDQKGITKWLKSKNIINYDEILLSFHDFMPWTQTGGETYGCSFEFSTEKYTKQVFIKAIVTFSPEKSLQSWVRRRKIISDSGIPVSNWYYFGEAVIIEDFYPNTFQIVPFEKLLAIGQKLDQLGFSTLKFTDDIRADNNGNPFFIDFGFDLGEPSDKSTTTAKDYLLKNYPDKQSKINLYYKQLLL